MEKAEKQPTLIDQFRTLKITAIDEIRKHGDRESVKDPEKAFMMAFGFAEDELTHGNDIDTAALYLTDHGVSETIAASVLMIWKKISEVHPDAAKGMH